MTDGSADSTRMMQVLRFDTLKRHYRVFAVPNIVRTRTEARRIGKWIGEALLLQPDGAVLPAREPEAYGSPLQWDVFLFAGKCDEKSLLNAFQKAKPEVEPLERKKRWRKERDNYVTHFREIEQQIRRIFPRQ
jgi:hypothetical protein